MSTSYGQFCPIAKASEIFATRWTPLIVREVMSGVHSFNDIHRGVPLISRAVVGRAAACARGPWCVNATSGAGKHGGKPRKIGEGRAMRSGERPGV
jgi:HxlR-like helix-turn-helix